MLTTHQQVSVGFCLSDALKSVRRRRLCSLHVSYFVIVNIKAIFFILRYLAESNSRQGCVWKSIEARDNSGTAMSTWLPTGDTVRSQFPLLSGDISFRGCFSSSGHSSYVPHFKPTVRGEVMTTNGWLTTGVLRLGRTEFNLG